MLKNLKKFRDWIGDTFLVVCILIYVLGMIGFGMMAEFWKDFRKK